VPHHQIPEPLARRKFLLKSGALVAASAALGLVFPVDRAWALATQTLTGPESATLLRFAWLLYPISKAPEQVYVDFVERLDRQAAGDVALAELLRGGVQQLGADGKNWLSLGEEEQVAAMRRIEATPFFGRMRHATLHAVFNDERTWKVIGFQGSAVEHGGYVNRGFNDIKWVPTTGPAGGQ
jgi:hypothetical protein